MDILAEWAEKEPADSPTGEIEWDHLLPLFPAGGFHSRYLMQNEVKAPSWGKDDLKNHLQ